MKKIKEKRIVLLSLVMAMFLGLFAGSGATAYAASRDTTVYLTKTGKCYHADGCSGLRRSKIPTTLQAAVDKGFKPCSNCHPVTLDAASTTPSASTNVAANKTSTAANTAAAVAAPVKEDPAVEALKTYKGNTKDFNAYTYYAKNADLQSAIGANADALLKHYNDYGKAEGRIAK